MSNKQQTVGYQSISDLIRRATKELLSDENLARAERIIASRDNQDPVKEPEPEQDRDHVHRDAQVKTNSPAINQEIDRPSHYGSKSGQDVIDVAEDFDIIDNAYKFNILKYLLRGGKKANNSELQDMLKIRVYLNRYIEKLQDGI